MARHQHHRRLATGALLGAAILATGCAAPATEAPEPTSLEAPAPIVLTEEGERYLTDVFLFACAPEYIGYPTGEGPPIPVRSEAQRRARRSELERCVSEEAADRYSRLEVVRALTWNGRTHSMSERDMQGIVQFGDTFVQSYVERLLEDERRREGTAEKAAPAPSEAPEPAEPDPDAPAPEADAPASVAPETATPSDPESG